MLKIKEFTNPNSDSLSSLSVSPRLLNRVQVFEISETKTPQTPERKMETRALFKLAGGSRAIRASNQTRVHKCVIEHATRRVSPILYLGLYCQKKENSSLG